MCIRDRKSAWRRHSTLQEIPQLPAPQDQERQLLPLLRALPQRQRVSIYLYYYEGLAVREIARILSARESTVTSWLHRGREKLRTQLKGEIEDVT